MKKLTKVKKRKAREWWSLVDEDGYLYGGYPKTKSYWSRLEDLRFGRKLIKVREVLKK